MTLLFVAMLFLMIGIVLLRKSQASRQHLGLPNGEVFYQDHNGQPMKAVTLSSRVYGLRGKPDCLIRTQDGIVPVELKKSARPPAHGGVYPSHYGEHVPYGLVLYRDDATRKVIPTPENIAWLASNIQELRAARSLPELDRSHCQKGRCRGCGMKYNCNQSLDTES